MTSSKVQKSPLLSHRYDRSAVIRPQNPMAARPNPRKCYDPTPAETMTSKKFVTGDLRIRASVPQELSETIIRIAVGESQPIIVNDEVKIGIDPLFDRSNRCRPLAARVVLLNS